MVKLSEILKQTISNINQNKTSGHTNDRAIRMSDAGKCIKALYFKVMEYDSEEIPSDTRMVFEYGHHMHDWLQRMLKASTSENLYHSEEMTLHLMTPKFRTVYGHCDMMMGEDTILEFKTTSMKSFKYLKARGIANENHILQASMYAVAAGRPNIKIVYFNRTDDSDWFYEFDTTVNVSLVDAELKRFDTVYDMAVKLEIPNNSLYTQDKFPCSWGSGACQYFNHCW